MSAPRIRTAVPAPGADPVYDDRPDYELWQRVDATKGAYHWMVWRVGPMHGEDAEWFQSEDDARARYSELMGEAS